ncbi:hypothetical enoyl-coa hydratase (partial sequence) protein (N-terminal fragment) [Ralstonia solanacearum IPO1609]|uniref:Hypothetical enoyl-coa hydratase (Partial sequence) protein (N-terminal) n=1 Tax=Ralstonia solanacearum IPO1609 TaxID=564066 RepID=A0ABF7RH45_RALSL|nr:hypothetical enoyl-coa hydratase (partial sequence) protein (N-terminal fragment) [Ralstonia solanacearum IPO1609]
MTLNRRKALNALNDALMDELGAALFAFDADEGIGAMVITGSDKAFAAGADIGAMADYDFATVYKNEYITRNWETIRRIRKPVIAAVAGYALGGGHDVRHHPGGRHRQVRSAGDQARHHAGRGRHPATAARGLQGQGHGLVPDRAHDGRRRGGTRRPGFTRHSR